MAETPSALTSERAVRKETWKFHQFLLKANQTAFKGGIACIKQSDGKCYAGVLGSGYVIIGLFAESTQLAGASGPSVDTLVNVELFREVQLTLFDNATSGDAVNVGTATAPTTDFGKDTYFFDDHSVSITSTSSSKAGRVWRCDSTGVLIEAGVTAASGS
jgi:hypothetical protein